MSDGDDRDLRDGNRPSGPPTLRPIRDCLPPHPKRFPHLSKLDDWVTPEQDPAGIVYQHSVLCQTFLPYRDPGDDVRVWERSNGFLQLKLIAGDSADPDQARWIPVGLPFGPKARLVLYHLNAEALRTRSPTIELAASLTKFVRHTLALSSDGRTIATVKDQLTRLAAADFRIQLRSGDRTLVLKSAFMDQFTRARSGACRITRWRWTSTRGSRSGCIASRTIAVPCWCPGRDCTSSLGRAMRRCASSGRCSRRRCCRYGPCIPRRG